MRNSKPRFWASIVSLTLILAALAASSAASDSHPVTLNVTVTDDLNRMVSGLHQDAFQIFEDKVPQPIVSFDREDVPTSIGIVFDISGSMGGTLESSHLGVASFLKTANPEDEAFLVEFRDRPELVVPMTNHFDEIPDRLAEATAMGRTALIDGVYLALETMKKARNPRKALIVISDGADNSSRYKAAEIANVVRETDVQIYTIGFYEAGSSRDRRPEALAGSGMLRYLSEPTGGTSFVVENMGELPDVAAKIGIELRNRYVIGYNPTNQARDGKYRKITVKLVPQRGLPGLHAFWRFGYFAPTR